MKTWLFGICLMVMGSIVPTICIVKSIQFNQNCGGYLKQAADANTTELALERINIALDYIEENKLTDGYTSVLWRTEDENVEYWYRNIKACKAELEGCMDASSLEKSNVLMKVRESLTDSNEKGVDLTVPDGISRFPDNALWGWLRLISYIVLIVGIGFVVYWYSEETY